MKVTEDLRRKAERAVRESLFDEPAMVELVDQVLAAEPNPREMTHRHLEPGVGYTAAAIDSVIERGGLEHWAHLRAAALSDREVFERLEALCVARAGDPLAPWHRFWAAWMTLHGGAR